MIWAFSIRTIALNRICLQKKAPNSSEINSREPSAAANKHSAHKCTIACMHVHTCMLREDRNVRICEHNWRRQHLVATCAKAHTHMHIHYHVHAPILCMRMWYVCMQTACICTNIRVYVECMHMHERTRCTCVHMNMYAFCVRACIYTNR